MKNIFTKYHLEKVEEVIGTFECTKRIKCKKDVETVLNDVLRLNKLAEESLYLLCMDIKNMVVGISEITKGGVDGAVVDLKNIAKRVLLANGSKFILVHNHPSGDCIPSSCDMALAKKSLDMINYFDLKLIDFIIVGDGIYSFSEEGILC